MTETVLIAFGGERPRKDAVRGARLTIEVGAEFPIGILLPGASTAITASHTVIPTSQRNVVEVSARNRPGGISKASLFRDNSRAGGIKMQHMSFSFQLLFTCHANVRRCVAGGI